MQQLSTASLPQWYRRAAKAGLVAKGIVYCLSGAIALFAALNLGGGDSSDAGKAGIFSWVESQPFGKWMVLALGIGLACYSFWRWIQALKDTEHKGDDKKGIATRAAYLFSGLGYAGVAWYAFKVFSGTRDNGDQQQALAARLLDQPFGQWLVAIVALIMAGVGIYQLYRAFSGKYKKQVRAGLHERAGQWIPRIGVAGYTARGIVWLIIAWFFMRAAIAQSPREAGGSEDVFSWLENGTWGTVLLGTVAFGLFCYGLFMFIRAKYQPIHLN